MKASRTVSRMPSVPENHGVSQNGLPITVAGVGADSGQRRLVGIQEIAVLVQQPLILMAGLQDRAHLGFVGFQLRGSLGDPHFQDFVQPAQIVLGLLGGGDVVGDADEADMLAGRVPARLGFRAQPSPFAAGVAVAGFQHERLERGLAGDRFLHDPLLVVRVKPLAPVERDGFLERQPEKIDIGLVGEGARAVELGDPHRHRRAVGDQAEALLAFAQLFLRQHPVGGVDMGADQPQRASLAVAFDLGDDVDPARLAVARPHDAVGGGIVLVAAGKRVEKLFDRPLAIVGMDSLDPVFVGFVGRIRRQAVDDEIFRRAAILESVAEVDFDAADARRCAGSAPVPLRVPAGRDEPGRARCAISCRCCRKRSAAAASGRTFEVSEGVMRAGNLCRHFHTGDGGFASFICSLAGRRGNYRPGGTRPPARPPRSKTSGPDWPGPDRSGTPADDRCRGSR